MNQKTLQACIAMIQSGDTDLVQAAIDKLKNGTVPERKPRKPRGVWRPEYVEEASKLRAKGWSWERIGRRLGVAGNTVSSHTQSGK